MTKEENKKNKGKNFLTKVSYGTGKFLRTVTKISKVADSKPWKNVVTATHDLCETVGEKSEAVLKKVEKTVKKNAKEMKKSFDAGMEAVTDEAVATGTLNTAGRDEARIMDALESKAEKEVASSLKKKAQGKSKEKAKGLAKKTKDRAAAEKEPSVNADLEKEIETVTKDVKDV